jgi:hypothetical protein
MARRQEPRFRLRTASTFLALVALAATSCGSSHRSQGPAVVQLRLVLSTDPGSCPVSVSSSEPSRKLTVRDPYSQYCDRLGLRASWWVTHGSWQSGTTRPRWRSGSPLAKPVPTSVSCYATRPRTSLPSPLGPPSRRPRHLGSGSCTRSAGPHARLSSWSATRVPPSNSNKPCPALVVEPERAVT